MDKVSYMQQLVNQGYSDEQILAMVEKKFPEGDEPKKTTDPLKQETSMGSQDMVSKSDDGSLESQGPSMGPVASLEEQFGFEPPKDIERMQEVKITVPKSGSIIINIKVTPKTNTNGSIPSLKLLITPRFLTK